MPDRRRDVGVMHLIDTLDAGGAEGVAVAMANHLVGSGFVPHLCTTRRDGVLDGGVRAEVGRLNLGRSRRIDVSALGRLQAYIRTHEIRILHAHSTSLLTAVLVSLMAPYPRVVWHDHYGGLITSRPLTGYRLLAFRVDHAIAVSEPLAAWSRGCLRLPAERVHYVPNFVALVGERSTAADLPGDPGYRIVCVANLREQKDHPTLIRAMARVVEVEPRAHLLLAGNLVDEVQVARVREEIRNRGLDAHVTLLGMRQDIAAVLRSCDIGVLSSVSEGLPLSLLEYGVVGLPAVATRVGQCSEVLDGGSAGVLVSPRSHDQLAAAVLALLQSPEHRAELGIRLRQRVQERYSSDSVMHRIEAIYHCVLDRVAAPR